MEYLGSHHRVSHFTRSNRMDFKHMKGPVGSFNPMMDEDDEIVGAGQPSFDEQLEELLEDGGGAPHSAGRAGVEVAVRVPAPPASSPVSAQSPGGEKPAKAPTRGGKRHRERQLQPLDYRVLQFLAYARYSTARQVSDVLGESYKQSYNRMARLDRGGWVRRELGPGQMSLWVPTKGGYDEALEMGLLLSENCPLGTRITETSVRHQLYVNQLMMFLVTGNKKGFKGSSLVNLLEEPMDYDALVTEYGISSQWNTAKRHVADALKSRGTPSAWHIALDVKRDLSPESLGHYVLVGEQHLVDKGICHQSRTPDLVVDDGTKKYYLEVELAAKKPADLQKILALYIAEQAKYTEVVWAIDSEERGKALMKALHAAHKKFYGTNHATEQNLVQVGKMRIIQLRYSDGAPVDRFRGLNAPRKSAR